MSDLAAIVVLAGAVVSAVGIVGGAVLWLAKPRIAEWVIGLIAPLQTKVDETHKQVTVNGGKNSPPTLPDLLSHVATKDQVDVLAKTVTDHITWSSEETNRLWAAIARKS